jgi:protein TonB
VVDAEPPGMFDQASIRAAERFRFQPRVVNGQPVEVPNVQYVFRFQLEE